MGVEHQMARLTARGVQITGAGFGGTVELSQTDVAWALAGLHGPAYWYMRLKFCGDKSVLKDLVNSVAFSILGEAMTGNVDVTAQRAPRLAMVAIMQATDGPLCIKCDGTGVVIKPDSAKECGTCRGTGRVQMTQDRAASIAKMSIPTYTKYYERLVSDYVALLEGYESRGLSHVARRIRQKEGA